MNFFAKLFGGSYDDLWKAVIRPPRDDYSDTDLGPEKFIIKGKNYKRSDFSIVNNRNHKLQCSYWEPYDEEREHERLPCVIYLHGNSSSRAEAASEVKYLLPMNITLFAFDFSGCGKSEGDYISLGWYEREDVESVVDFLRKSNKVSTIGLWGRSMGAVTAIMYGDRDPSVAGLVLDSPFSSLKMLVEELVRDKVSLPNFILNQALNLVKSSVQKKAKFKLEDIEPILYAKRCFIPALFVAAKDDNFVRPHHAKMLHDVYPGDKNIVDIEGDHNSLRPRFFKDSAAIFFYNTLQVSFIKEISDNYAGFIYEIKKEDNPEGHNKNNSLTNEEINSEGVLIPRDTIESYSNIADDEEEVFYHILEISKQEFENCKIDDSQSYQNKNQFKTKEINIEEEKNREKTIQKNTENDQI